MNSYSVINYPVESFLAKLKSNKNDKKKGNKLPDKQRNSETNSTKKQFNVLIPIEPPYSIFNKEKSEIDGYSYDFWQIIKKKLENENYLFKETHVRTSDFNELIDEIQQGKYDIAPFPFFPSAEREKKVNFTLPIMYEKVAIVHRPLSDHKLIFFDYILKTVVPFMFIILAFGFLYNKVCDIVFLEVFVCFKLFDPTLDTLDPLTISIVPFVALVVLVSNGGLNKLLVSNDEFGNKLFSTLDFRIIAE